MFTRKQIGLAALIGRPAGFLMMGLAMVPWLLAGGWPGGEQAFVSALFFWFAVDLVMFGFKPWGSSAVMTVPTPSLSSSKTPHGLNRGFD